MHASNFVVPQTQPRQGSLQGPSLLLLAATQAPGPLQPPSLVQILRLEFASTLLGWLISAGGKVNGEAAQAS